MSADGFRSADIADCPRDPPHHERHLAVTPRGGRVVFRERTGTGWIASDCTADLEVWK